MVGRLKDLAPQFTRLRQNLLFCVDADIRREKKGRCSIRYAEDERLVVAGRTEKRAVGLGEKGGDGRLAFVEAKPLKHPFLRDMVE